MNRTIKNIVLIVMIVVGVICTFFTIQSISSQSLMPQNMQQINPFDPGNKDDRGEMMVPGGQMPQFDPSMQNNQGQRPDNMGNRNPFEQNQLSLVYYALFFVEALVISLCVIYLLMSKANAYTFKETFVNKDKITIFILSLIIMTYSICYSDVYVAKSKLGFKSHMMMNDEYQADLSGDDIDKGEDVQSTKINLSNYKSNITISKAGYYILSGTSEYAVLVEADGEVTLTLDNINITCSNTAAIANRSTYPLNIELKGINTLKDGGKSEYNAVIYSAGPMTFDGDGTLYAYGNQEEGIASEANDITFNGGTIYVECNDDGINAGGDGGLITFNDGIICVDAKGDGIDSNQAIEFNGGQIFASGSSAGGDAGIDCDSGYTINGGLVVALGSDMLQSPTSSSKQKTICTTLDTVIKEGSIVSLFDESDKEVVTFKANEDFKTLTISSPIIKEGTYSLYMNGEHSGEVVGEIYSNGHYTKGDFITTITLK